MNLYCRCINELSLCILKAPRLEHLNLSDCPIRPIQEMNKPIPSPNVYKSLFRSIAHHPSITELLLKNCRLRTPDADLLLTPLLLNTRLEVLDISENPLLGQSTEKIALIQEVVMRHPSLKLANLANTSMRLSTLKDTYKHNTSLTELNLSDNFFSDQNGETTPLCLFKLPSLVSLTIERTAHHVYRRTGAARQFSDETFALLIRALDSHPSLTSLNLQRSFVIEDEQSPVTASIFQRFVETLKTIPYLTELDLSHTHFGRNPEMSEAFGKEIHPNRMLRSLALRNNHFSFSAIYPFLAGTQTLSSLDFSENPLSEENVSQLRAILATNTSLEKLGLAKTGLRSEQIQEIAAGLASNSSLTSLNIKHNQVDHPTIETLGNSLFNHPSLTELQSLPPLHFYHPGVDLPSLWVRYHEVITPHLIRNQENAAMRANTLCGLLLRAGTLEEDADDLSTSSERVKRQRTH